MDYGHWETEEGIKEDSVGFVYEIRNNLNGRTYIGKKILRFTKRTKPKKGKVRGTVKKVDSDWKEYTGSSKELNDDIQFLGKGHFTFKIIKFCNSKWDLSWSEAERIILKDAIRSEGYYNGGLQLRLGKAAG